MQLNQMKPLLGHCGEVAVQAVDDDDFGRFVPLDGLADRMGELPGGQFGRVDLLHGDAAASRCSARLIPKPAARLSRVFYSRQR